MAAAAFQVNDDGTKVDVTNTMFYLSTVAPLNVSQQRFPIEAPHWVFDVIQPQLEACSARTRCCTAGCAC